MRKYAKEHNAWLEARKDRELTSEEWAYHLQMIAFLQHERAVHLPVMLIALIGFLALVILSFFRPTVISLIGVLMTGILSGFYIEHYYFLENTVQAWYRFYSDRKAEKKQA